MQFSTLPRQPKDFQQPPQPEQVEAMCRRMLGSGHEVISATEIGGGFFNNTFVIELADDSKRVLRVSPPHGHPLLFSNERYLLRREFALTPWLASAAPLLPKVCAVDFTCELMPRDAVMSVFIEGENWDSVMKELSPGQNDAIWRELATLLRGIHQTRGTYFGWCTPESGYSTWSGFLVAMAKGFLEDCRRLGICHDEPREWLKVVEKGHELLDEVREPRMVHGDPWPKNVLIRREGDSARIVGLLDHERGFWGDPMDEWIFHYMEYPPVFWEAYGPRPTGPAARFRNCVYKGMIDVQVILEAPRYHSDASAAYRQFEQTMLQMEQCLAEYRA